MVGNGKIDVDLVLLWWMMNSGRMRAIDPSFDFEIWLWFLVIVELVDYDSDVICVEIEEIMLISLVVQKGEQFWYFSTDLFYRYMHINKWKIIL